MSISENLAINSLCSKEKENTLKTLILTIVECNHWSLSSVWWTVLTLLEEMTFSVVGYNEYEKKRRLRYVSRFLSDFVFFVIWYPYMDNSIFLQVWVTEKLEREENGGDGEKWQIQQRRHIEVQWSLETGRSYHRSGATILCFPVRNITQSCLLYLTYAMFTQNQLYCFYISAMSFI